MSKKSSSKPKGSLSRRQSAIRWSELSSRESRLLLYRIAQLRFQKTADGRVRSWEDVAREVKLWIQARSDKEGYRTCGTISASSIGRNLDKIIEHGFVKLGRDNELDIHVGIERRLRAIHGTSLKPFLVVAPDGDELLRYLWEDLDNLLVKAVNKNREHLIVGVGGGHTMLKLAQKLRELVDLEWWRIPPEQRKKVVICSLTCGGFPSDITVLSDNVAGTIASSLGVRAQGLLGPTLFTNMQALSAFRQQEYVREHVKLVKNADIIITSFEYLGEENALISRLLKSQGQHDFLKNNPNLADILYNCYDGITGAKLRLPISISNRLFSAVDIEDLKRMVAEGKRVIGIATGREKGSNTLMGLIRGRPKATDLYMDLDAASSLRIALDTIS